MKSIALAFAMFSRLPMPGMELKEENMRYVMAAFPLVGIAVGLGAALWGWLCGFFGFGAFLRGTGFALVPLLLTGGIHMDGLCDTADAVASRGDVEKKQRILRDPHAGAFAAIAACAYLLAFAAFASEMETSPRMLSGFAAVFVSSRCLSGLATLTVPGSPASDLGKGFQNAADARTSVALICLSLAGAGVFLASTAGLAGAAAFALPFPLFLWWRRVAVRQFGGMSGDLAGCLLLLSELVSVAALAVVPKVLLRF